jgi:hypothetical protein
LCGVVRNVARVDLIVSPTSMNALSSFDEVDLIIKLVVGKLGELFVRDKGQAMVQDVGQGGRMQEGEGACCSIRTRESCKGSLGICNCQDIQAIDRN